jgi:hypothetical protein
VREIEAEKDRKLEKRETTTIKSKEKETEKFIKLGV